MANDIEAAKRCAGAYAAGLVENGMLVGLGTGTTASYFIAHLIERFKEGLKFKAIATSDHSQKKAAEAGIPMVDVQTVTSLDLTVDGADEIDPKKRMIKGGGGALLREKIVANMSREMVVVVDFEKLVPSLGRFPLPVEILPFGSLATIHKLGEMGYSGVLRKRGKNEIYLTDNGNYIFDISNIGNPERDDEKIKTVPGVLETGFFFNLAKKVIVGYSDGHVEVLL